jgi:hypothetical protein
VADQTNILFLQVDNLGFGELSCYCGGPFRDVTTKRNFKLMLVQQRPHLHAWAAYHLNGIIEAFQASVRREPLIPMGAPLDHAVTRNSPER